MSITNACVLWLGVCAFSTTAMAQGVGGIAASTGEAGFRYAYNSVATSDSAESNQSGGAVYGEFFLGRTTPMWHGQSRLSLIGDISGSGSGSARLYTFLGGIRLNTEWRKSHLVLHSEYKIGGDHVRVYSGAPVGPASYARNGFVWDIVGLGLDVRAGQHYVVTLLQLDFPTLEVPDPISGAGHWRDTVRLSGGIGYRFGSKP